VLRRTWRAISAIFHDNVAGGPQTPHQAAIATRRCRVSRAEARQEPLSGYHRSIKCEPPATIANSTATARGQGDQSALVGVDRADTERYPATRRDEFRRRAPQRAYGDSALNIGSEMRIGSANLVAMISEPRMLSRYTHLQPELIARKLRGLS
jgi:hypothetical protein